MSADHSDAHGLTVLWFWAVSADVDRPQVYHAFTVRSGAGDFLRCDFADEETVARTAYIFLPNWSIFYWRGLVAEVALDDVLVRLALHTDGALAHSAADDRGTAAVRAALGRVWRRGLTRER